MDSERTFTFVQFVAVNEDCENIGECADHRDVNDANPKSFNQFLHLTLFLVYIPYMLGRGEEALCVADKRNYHEYGAEPHDAVNALGRNILEYDERCHADKQHGRAYLARKECAVEHFSVMEQAACHYEHEALLDKEHDKERQNFKIAKRKTDNNYALCQLVRERVKHYPDARAHIEFSCNKTVDHVGQRRYDEHRCCYYIILRILRLHIQYRVNRNEQYPENAQEIWNCEDFFL